MRSLTSCMFSVALAVGGAAAAQAATPPLRLCADPANLPFSSNETDAVARGTPGLYVEIGQAVAEALGRPMETVWSHSHFGKRNVRTTLLAGQCDLVVGLPAVPDFMGPRVVYTRPMLNLGYALVVPKERAFRQSKRTIAARLVCALRIAFEIARVGLQRVIADQQ